MVQLQSNSKTKILKNEFTNTILDKIKMVMESTQYYKESTKVKPRNILSENEKQTVLKQY